MRIRALQDNVFLELEPLPQKSESGLLFLPDDRKLQADDYRIGRAYAVGPGHYEKSVEGRWMFKPTEIIAGERCIIPKLAGNIYELDVGDTRHNEGTEFRDGVKEARIVREAEILAILD